MKAECLVSQGFFGGSLRRDPAAPAKIAGKNRHFFAQDFLETVARY
jgi:hypothetical protein